MLKTKLRKKYRLAVFIVTYRKNKKIEYLVLKRKLHWIGWEFPKGGIEKKENSMKAVKRELMEETGHKAIKIKKFNIKGKYKYHKLLDDRPGFIGQTFKLFSAQVPKNKIKLDRKEHSDYKWLPYKKAFKTLTWQNQKKCLKIVNEELSLGK
jgi:8-oxo-dGTP pyrophosphatase MutT (NUDIX family)